MLKLPWPEENSACVALLYLLFSIVSAVAWLRKASLHGNLVGHRHSPQPLGLSAINCWVYGVSTVGLLLATNLVHNRDAATLLGMVILVQILMGMCYIASQEKEAYGWLRLNWLQILAFGICGAGAVQLISLLIGGSEQALANWLHFSLATQNPVDEFKKLKTWSEVESALLTICLIAPLLEEILFRGFIFAALKKYFSTWSAIILSGAIFGAMHLNLPAFLPLWFLGSILALVYENTGSLSASVALHSCFNLTTCISILVFPDANNP